MRVDRLHIPELSNRIVSLQGLPHLAKQLSKQGYCENSDYPTLLTPYYAGLITGDPRGDPVAVQSVPRQEELDTSGHRDPLREDLCSPIPGLVHVYENRVLLMPTTQCAVNCRYCNRRWKRYPARTFGQSVWDEWGGWLGAHESVREVLITGGDPLTLTDDVLEALLRMVRRHRHIGVIRIGTRIPVTLPQRVTVQFCEMLSRYHPIFLHTQFNCREECTDLAAIALGMLADAGANLGNQMVLLAGVNDDATVIADVNDWLVRQRCRPYYLFVTEAVASTLHLGVSIEKAVAIGQELERVCSGIAMPRVVVDTPDGGGKVLLGRGSVEFEDGHAVVTDHRGRKVRFMRGSFPEAAERPSR